ncbi:MAG: SufE family protein [Pseudomonadota bacterium]
MSIDTAAAEIRDEFDFLDDWEARYAHIIDLGKANPGLPAPAKVDQNRVRGCASQVWMVTRPENDALHIEAESDAMIVSGLIALLTRLFSGARAADILAFDPQAFFDEIGVSGALSAQRSNGLASMIARIRSEANALANA